LFILFLVVEQCDDSWGVFDDWWGHQPCEDGFITVQKLEMQGNVHLGYKITPERSFYALQILQ